jgi:dTDP-4-dehydrorhamnose reductase
MKVLVIGGDGMLGHRLLLDLAAIHEVRVSLRRNTANYVHLNLFDQFNSYFGVDVRHQESVLEVLADFRPEAIVNAAGIVKQRDEAKQSIPSIEVNALFPHQLAVMAQACQARLIHLSTDCVFSGSRGGYTELDQPDPVDLYGRSKLLGEVRRPGCLTLRTSIIGLELANRHGLVEWFLAQKGPVPGYRRAMYSGFTTQELTRIINNLITHHFPLTGVWHVASQPISKHDLLTNLAGHLAEEDRWVEPNDDFVCDRTLNADAFNRVTGYSPPTWDEMLEELAETIRRSREAKVL